MKPYRIVVIALSLIATGCASTAKLPQANGVPVKINSTDEIQALLSEYNGLELIGPRKDDENVRAQFMRQPFMLLTRQPNPDDFERLGAALVERTVTVTFPFSSTEFMPNGSQQFHIAQLLARATRVQIRARTDNEVSTPESVWYATQRAEAAKRYLIDRKMPSTDIATNVMGAGDPVANNSTAKGRAKNRRVEIEFFFEGGTS